MLSTRLPLVALVLALAFAACDRPPLEPEPDEILRRPVVANAWEIPEPPDVPPLERAPTFWTCAGKAEGQFADAVARIIVLEALALAETDPLRQAQRWAEIDRLKNEAQAALHLALTVCVEQYGAPRFFLLPDENGKLVSMPFSVAVYHGYLVKKYLHRF